MRIFMILCALAVWLHAGAWAQEGARERRAPAALDGTLVGQVKTLGLDIPAPERLHRLLGIELGAPYDSAAVANASQELMALGWLEEVRVLATKNQRDSLVVVVLVERTPAVSFHPLLMRLPDSRFVFGGRLHVWSGSGRGEGFEIAMGGGGRKLVQLQWSEPRPFVRSRLALRFHADVTEEIEEAEGNLDFDRVVLGATLIVPLRGPRLELYGSLWQVRAAQEDGAVSSTGIDHLRQASVALAWGAMPKRFGWSYTSLRVGLGASAGSAEYQDVRASLRLARKLSGHWIVAAGIGYRDARGTVPRYDRRHLGGSPTLRGHRYGVASGDAAAWSSFEMRFPLNFWSPETFTWTPFPFEFHVFGDAGTAWRASAPGATSQAPTFAKAQWRWSAGAGFGSFIRGRVPLRIDLGRDDDGIWRAQLATSYSF
jgi:hypothetical protein